MEDALFENALGLIVSKKANQEDGVKQSGNYEIGVYSNSYGWCHLKSRLEVGDKIVCNKDDAQINLRLLNINIGVTKEKIMSMFEETTIRKSKASNKDFEVVTGPQNLRITQFYIDGIGQVKEVYLDFNKQEAEEMAEIFAKFAGLKIQPSDYWRDR